MTAALVVFIVLLVVALVVQGHTLASEARRRQKVSDISYEDMVSQRDQALSKLQTLESDNRMLIGKLGALESWRGVHLRSSFAPSSLEVSVDRVPNRPATRVFAAMEFEDFELMSVSPGHVARCLAECLAAHVVSALVSSVATGPESLPGVGERVADPATANYRPEPGERLPNGEVGA